MPHFADYQIWLCGWDTGKLTQLFPGDDFLSILWHHKINDLAEYELQLVAETDTKDRFVVDYGILIERDAGKGFYEEGYFFHQDEDEWIQSGQGVDEHYWKSSGYSPDWLLDQPALQPVPNPNPNYLSYDKWWAFGPADDVIKLMASESMGGAVSDPDREFTHFAVQGNLSRGLIDCYDGRFERLLEKMREVVGEDGGRGGCDFRVVHVSGGFELQTFAPFYGTDRREGNGLVPPTVFSLENDNMLNPRRRVIRANEATVAIGAWQGVGMNQDIYQEVNADALAESPYRRREALVDVSDVTQPETIPSLLQQVLQDEGALEIVEFQLIQTEACLYGIDFALGDLCTAEVFGRTYDVRITEVAGSLDGQNEEAIEPRVKLWTREV